MVQPCHLSVSSEVPVSTFDADCDPATSVDERAAISEACDWAIPAYLILLRGTCTRLDSNVFGMGTRA